MFKCTRVISAIILVIATGTAAFAAPANINYIPLPNEAVSSTPGNISSGDFVTGYSSTSVGSSRFDRAFISDLSGRIQLLETPGGYLGSYSYDVNSSGTAVGILVKDWSGYLAPPVRPVIWDANGSAHILVPDGIAGYANAINNAGVVVGSVYDPATPLLGFRAAMWDVDGNRADIGGLSYASDINNIGQIAGRSADGYAAVIDSSGNINRICQGYAYQISDLGYVIGAREGSSYQPFFWSEQTGVVDIPAPSSLQAQYMRAVGVNDLGQVVGHGRSLIDGKAYDFDFIWSSGTGTIDLSAVTGVINWVGGINNKAQILSASDRPDQGLLVYQFIPEPNSIIPLALGLSLLAGSMLRRKR